MNPNDFLSLFPGSHCFQWFHENPLTPEEAKVKPGNIVGNYAERKYMLADLNKRGAGIYFTVNETDGLGRKEENIKRVRALFVDLDDAPLGPVQTCAVRPNLIVQTSPAKYHAYWFVDDVERHEFRELQILLAIRFGGDRSVKDLGRVARLPGFINWKRDPFQVTVIDNNNYRYSKIEIYEKLGLENLRIEQAVEAKRNVSLGEILINSPVRGERHDTLFSLARKYAAHGLSRSELVLLLQTANANFAEPLPKDRADTEIERIIQQVEAYEGGVLGSADLVWDKPPEDIRINNGDEEVDVSIALGALSDIKMTPELITSAPGPTGELVKAFLESAQWPIPSLALQSALVCLSTIKERKYQGYFGGWCNLYTIGTAPAAAGKGHGLTCVENILTVVGADNRVVGKCVSGPAVFTALQRGGNVALSMVDEAGLYFEQLLSWKFQDKNSVGLRETLMVMFNAKRKVKGSEYSSRGGTPHRLDVENPFFGFYGVCTPETFFNTLNKAHSLDGFVSRILYFEGEHNEERKRNWGAKKVVLDQDLIDYLIELNNLGGSYYADPLPLEFLDESFALYKGYVEVIDRVVQECKDIHHKPIRGRLVEYFDKLVTIVADGNKVTPAIVNWAFQCAVACNNSLISKIESCTFESEIHKITTDMLAWIRQYPDGVTQKALTKKFLSVPIRQRTEAILTLVETEDVKKQFIKVNRSHKPTAVFVARKRRQFS